MGISDGATGSTQHAVKRNYFDRSDRYISLKVGDPTEAKDVTEQLALLGFAAGLSSTEVAAILKRREGAINVLQILRKKLLQKGYQELGIT